MHVVNSKKIFLFLMSVAIILAFSVPAYAKQRYKKAEEDSGRGVFLGVSILFPALNHESTAISGSADGIAVEAPTYPLRLMAGYRIGGFIPYGIFSLEHIGYENEIERKKYNEYYEENEDEKERVKYEVSATNLMLGAGARYHFGDFKRNSVSFYLLGEFFFCMMFGEVSDYGFDPDMKEDVKKYYKDALERAFDMHKHIGLKFGVGGEFHFAEHFGIGIDGGFQLFHYWYEFDYKEYEFKDEGYTSEGTLPGEDFKMNMFGVYAALNFNIYF